MNFPLPSRPSCSLRCQGFTLIELAVVIMIAGVILSLAIAFVLPILETARRLETEGKIEKIAAALHEYAVVNNRLPCPADPRRIPAGGEPFGTERGSGATGGNIPANCGAAANWAGALPYQTLGLPRDFAFDGYDNLLTYALSPAFSQNTADPALAVHASCRTIPWYYIISNEEVSVAGNWVKIVRHKNPRKARFCCPPDTGAFGVATDLDIRDGAGNAALNFVRDANDSVTGQPGSFCQPAATCNGLDCCSPGYAPTATPFTMAPNVPVLASDRTTAVAYVLISHGNNGANAAYNMNNGSRPAAPADANERENWDDDRVFRDVYDKGDRYDDIVFWRTQDLMFADQGESCNVP